MFLAEFLFVFLLALLFTVLFAFAQGWQTPWPALVWLFMVLLLGTWALGIWLRPIGPPMLGFYWGSFLAAIVVVLLLLLAAVFGPRPVRSRRREELKGVEIRPKRPAEERLEQEAAEANALRFFGVVFWVVMVFAAAALLIHYSFPGPD